MIVLTSNGFTQPKIYDYLVSQKVGKLRNACIIITAVLPEKEKAPWVINTQNDLLNKGFEKVSLYDFEVEDFHKLINYDLIYFMGGNPYNLLKYVKHIQVENMLNELHTNNKILIGRSAGSMVLSSGIHYVEIFNDIMQFGDEVRNTVGLSEFDGLKYSKQILFPHYDKAKLKIKNLENELLLIEKQENIVITRFNDTEAFFITNDNKMVCINVEGKIVNVES